MSPVVPAQGATRAPETLAAATAAVQAAGWATALPGPWSARSAQLGLADFGVGRAGSRVGCRTIYGFTGAAWRVLGHCVQDLRMYPAALPARIWVCAIGGAVVARTGPGVRFPVWATFARSTRVMASRLTLTKSGSNASARPLDGVGWFRIRVHARYAWVVSTRVADLDDTCANWPLYWRLTRHR